MRIYQQIAVKDVGKINKEDADKRSIGKQITLWKLVGEVIPAHHSGNFSLKDLPTGHRTMIQVAIPINMISKKCPGTESMRLIGPINNICNIDASIAKSNTEYIVVHKDINGNDFTFYNEQPGSDDALNNSSVLSVDHNSIEITIDYNNELEKFNASNKQLGIYAGKIHANALGNPLGNNKVLVDLWNKHYPKPVQLPFYIEHLETFYSLG